MSPRSVSDPLLREAPVLDAGEPVGEAVRRVLDSGLPALPVAGAGGRLCGIFGEREFMEALFPGYFGQLQSASFVRKALDEALEKRAGCTAEPVSSHLFTEHVEVQSDASDSQIAETFLHHAVLVVPVCEEGRVVGVITRRDFFRRLAERVLDRTP